MQHPRALTDYLNRIGAEVLTFKKAMVKQYFKGNSYYVERVLITFDDTGEVKVTHKDYAPTEAEQEAIKKAFLKVEFPSSVKATKAAFEKLLKDQKAKTKEQKELFFKLIDRKSGQIIMVQQRIVPTNGDAKYFVPWSFWSDGEWRKMECEGPLPFWKPDEATRVRIMIHEGCKAAKFCTDLRADKEKLNAHPWGWFIDEYDHWGMIGGAMAPHRADYAELNREMPQEVIYICDNDKPGKDALQKVSKAYGGPLGGVMFDSRWKESWDMADPMPENFWEEGHYLGPQLKEMIKPATYATELQMPADGKGKPVAVLRRFFQEEWVHCVKPEVFVHNSRPHNMLSAEEFNNHCRPYSDVKLLSELMIKDDSMKASEVKYDPSMPSGIYTSVKHGRSINTHLPSHIQAVEGDPGPWLDFMERLVPVESDRNELLRWCATLIAKPAVKMNYGVLLISEAQGVGKGTLGEKILGPLVGDHNVSYPSNSEIVESQFNDWLAHKRLAVIHELYAGQSSKAYNKLKSVITERTLNVNKKFMATYIIDNWINILACSNSLKAIKISHDDRRWFVPKCSESIQNPEYWTMLNQWLEKRQGLQIIRGWAERCISTLGHVRPSDVAPSSSTKVEVVEEGYSPGMKVIAGLMAKVNEALYLNNADREAFINQWIRPANTNGEWRYTGAIVSDKALSSLILNYIHQGRHSSYMESDLTIRKVVKSMGWFVHPDRTSAGTKMVSRFLVNSESMTRQPIKVILENSRLLDVNSLAKSLLEI